MIIEGSIASNKTELLIDKYCELINSGVKSSQILVLVQNSTLKNNFCNKVYEKLKINCIESLRIHSFFSLVYNTVSDNWAFLEERNAYDNPVILPNLAGLEVSQFIMKDILKEVPFKGYNSRLSLLHQIFRRYSLIIQNNLTQSDINNRAKILKEGFSDEASLAIRKLLKKTLELRDFDYLRQCLMFNFIYKNTDYFKDIKYILIDDADEYTPVCIDFIEHLSKQITDVTVAIDPKGSSRCGYLSADKNNYEKIKQYFPTSETIKLDENSQTFHDAEGLYENVKLNKQNQLNNFKHVSLSKRSQMVENAIKTIKLLFENKVKPCEISIITPVIDDMLKFTLRESFKSNINLKYLSGSEKLIQNRLVLAVITILKLNTELKNTLSEFNVRIILSEFLHIPLKYCEDILYSFRKTKNFIPYKFKDGDYDKKYSKFLRLLDNLAKSESKISEQIVHIYNELFTFPEWNKNEINKFNFFLKQIKDFENIFGENFKLRLVDIIIQTENSVISENPYSVLETGNNDLIVSTPQKIIDNHLMTKYQIWLDISNSEWIKSDTGPLYNSWVFQKDWDKETYTISDNIELSKDKNARVLRKLTLCAKNNIYCFSSLFDSNGIENYGAIEEYILIKTIRKTEKQAENNNFIPRDDQKPVMEYTKGYMGISAVPGAGKTTVLLALIIKLLDDGISPENIFVLTYMDSAARNFRERIKNIRKNSAKLPNISTIHGLALRILKENGNYEKLGLSNDFEICDDSQRSRILREISSKLKIGQKDIDDYDRAISVFKMNAGTLKNTTDKKLAKFKLFYEEYQNSLKDFNLIDYDDMLTGAVKILKDNPDISAFYQEICQYIIEDEAQDSSAIQQELITLLSAKHQNVIRCGDVNQSITSTFSNSDVEGFRKFIKNYPNVRMNCSQRCTKNVWKLANKLVDYTLQDKDKSNAFFPMYMQEVEGKNPISEKDSVRNLIFETKLDEKNYVLKLIKNTLLKNPNYTVGILLRWNYQVGEWQNLIENSGLKVITRNQCLAQKTVFRVIYAVLQMILNPFDNEIIGNNYDILAEHGLYKTGFGEKIKKYENPFIGINSDNIDNQSLEQFYWDINYWISLCHLPPNELAVKIGMQFFKNNIEKSNIYLISTLIKRICIKNNSLEYALSRLSELSKKPNLNGFKFFSEEDIDDKKSLEGKVQIMTMHKSKGDEFNLVIIPELTEKNLPLTLEGINLRSAGFIESIRNSNPAIVKKFQNDLKREILEENLRLLYVAITRAKNRLFISSNTQVRKNHSKEEKNKPSIIFKDILSNSVFGRKQRESVHE